MIFPVKSPKRCFQKGLYIIFHRKSPRMLKAEITNQTNVLKNAMNKLMSSMRYFVNDVFFNRFTFVHEPPYSQKISTNSSILWFTFKGIGRICFPSWDVRIFFFKSKSADKSSLTSIYHKSWPSFQVISFECLE